MNDHILGRASRGLCLLMMSIVLLASGSVAHALSWSAPQTLTPSMAPHFTMTLVNGNPAVACSDQINGLLLYITATDAAGSVWGAPQLVAADCGGSLSLAVVNGKPAIAYVDTASAIKYVSANDIDGIMWAAPVTVAGDVCDHPSLAEVEGKPAIAYQNASTAEVCFASAQDPNGAAWNMAQVLDVNGEAPSLKVANGKPAVVYYDGNGMTLKYVIANEGSGATWGVPLPLDCPMMDAADFDFALINGCPAAVYADTNGTLRFLRAVDPEGVIWPPTSIIACGADSMVTPTLAAIAGMPTVAYSEQNSHEMKYIAAMTVDGALWPAQAESVAAAIDWASCQPILAEANGKPAIAYYAASISAISYTVGSTVGQPDVLVKTAAAEAYTGDGLYQVAQTAAQEVAIAAPATYHLCVQNDAFDADTFTISTALTNDEGWSVVVYNALVDGQTVALPVTRAIPAGGSLDFRLVVTPQAPTANTCTVLFTATSTTDALRTDTVSAETSVPALSAVALATDLESPRLINDTITLTATATGGKSLQYQFKDGETILRDFAAANTFAWAPTTAGTYQLTVVAKDTNPETTVSSAPQSYVIANPLAGVALAADLPSPQLTTAAPITLTATADGGAHVVYQFKNGKTILRDFDADNTFAWTPDAGNYQLIVVARDLVEEGTPECQSALLAYHIDPALTTVTLTANPASPQLATVGPITLTAAADGGVAVTYQFKDGETILQDFGPLATASWQPLATGTYHLTVTARDSGTDPVTEATASVDYVIAEPLTDVYLSATPDFPRPVGTVITLEATPVGGANVEYAFYDGETLLRPFGTESTMTWTPEATGEHLLTVVARDASAPQATFTSLPYSYTITDVLSAVVLDVLLDGPRPANTAVPLQATPIGGANVVYQFNVDGVALADFDAMGFCDWLPATPGTYSLTVDAKDLATGQIVSSDPVSYTITAPLSDVTLTVDPEGPQPEGVAITLTAAATGGANIAYEFRDGENVLRPFAADATFTWTPTTAGDFFLLVVARDDNASGPSRVTSTVVPYSIAPALTAVTLTPDQAACLPMQDVVLTASPTGGLQVVYQFFVDGVPMGDFSDTATYTWTPDAQGTYELAVVAKDLQAVPPVEISSDVLPYTVGSPLSAVALQVGISTPRVVNSTIPLTAVATNGAHVEYQFKAGETVLRDFASEATFDWQPVAPGAYVLQVVARDLAGDPTVLVSSNTFKFTVVPALSAVDLIVYPSSPVIIGTEISLGATPTGGAQVQYKYLAGTTVIRDFTTDRVVNWTPTATFTGTLSVVARDVSLDPPTEVTSAPIAYRVTQVLSGVTINILSTTPRYKDTPITLKATAQGGLVVEYKFTLGWQDATGWQWVTLQDWGTADTCPWPARPVGKYQVRVYARDTRYPYAGRTVVKVVACQIIGEAPMDVILTTDRMSPQPSGTTVRLTATAVGSNDVEYQFRIGYKDTAGWQWLTYPWGTTNTLTWTPMEGRTYSLVVYARGAQNTSTPFVYTVKNYTITHDPVTGVTLSVVPPATGQQAVALTAQADGGAAAEYRFRVGYRDAGGWHWTVVQEWGVANVCYWTPADPTRTYTVVAYARSLGSTNIWGECNKVVAYTPRR